MGVLINAAALKYRENNTDPWQTLGIIADADLTSMADIFDEDSTYTEGELVMHGGDLCKCKPGGAGPGPWDDTEWTVTSVEAELNALRVALVQQANETETVENSLAIIVEGDTSAAGASEGQYVYLKDSTITGCNDGLYTAAQAIPADTVIDSTYLTAVSGGGLNDLVNNAPTNLLKGKNIPWKNAQVGLSCFVYETSTAASEYDVPTGYVAVFVLKHSTNGGAAIAVDWRNNSTDGENTWVNTYHGSTWRGWRRIDSKAIISEDYSSTISLAANESKSFGTLSRTKSGYTPIMTFLTAGSYGDYCCLNQTASLTSTTASITGYVKSVNTSSITVTLIQKVLWRRN